MRIKNAVRMDPKYRTTYYIDYARTLCFSDYYNISILCLQIRRDEVLGRVQAIERNRTRRTHCIGIFTNRRVYLFQL